ncbi:hypothetical protein MAR_036306 [Mya arenaria]|uniref:Uncharacterized protein n=1 Tax=Mya arenaria TaxID=6604 RepID=A0ABY7EPQ2_MYAAR|nr:hypothetical protein MAR_036306 [Mya arenaria]
MEHGRKYCVIVIDDIFFIVLELRSEQQFNGRFKYVGFQTSDRSDNTAVLKVYTSKKRGMKKIAACNVIIQDKVHYQGREDNYLSLSETVAEKKTRSDNECFRKNKSTHDKLVIPVVMKYRKACFMCFSINDSQRSEVVLELCSSRTAPERIEQRIRGIQVDYVRSDAYMFEVYSYVRRRIDEAIELCRDDNSSSDFCSENILIIFSDDKSTSGNNFYEGVTDIERIN